jgi:hypothetical protein
MAEIMCSRYQQTEDKGIDREWYGCDRGQQAKQASVLQQSLRLLNKLLRKSMIGFSHLSHKPFSYCWSSFSGEL